MVAERWRAEEIQEKWVDVLWNSSFNPKTNQDAEGGEEKGIQDGGR